MNVTLTRLARVNLALGAVATAIALLWIRAVGGFEGISGIAAVNWLYVAPMLALTAISVLVRFVRWQFLMRHAGSRLNERPSLLIYLASLVGTATPAYVGEAIRAVFLRRQLGVPARTSLFILVIERLLDVLALASIAGITAGAWWMRGVMVVIVIGAVIAVSMLILLGRAAGVSERVLGTFRRRDILVESFTLSLGAWVLPAFHVSLAAAALGASIGPLVSVRVFTSSVLLGGLTMMPAGIGATGTLAIVQLQSGGISLNHAILIVALVRLTTVAATLVVGSICLTALWRQSRPAAADARAHFDDIATEYGEQFRPHIWKHLLDRKVDLIARELPPPESVGHGLDLGCGLGSQCLAMRSRGFRVFGMDLAQKLVVRARRAGASVLAGSALALPFCDGTLDFVYAVGVLHHLPNREAQRTACAEVLRVLKPGGRFLVHETNTRNPLFRLYMGYLFPLLKKIDEGTEWWIEPRRWNTLGGLKVVHVHHFTFMPDFIPAWSLRAVVAIDTWLERSRLRPYSVHYMVVLEKDPSFTPAFVTDRFVEEPRLRGSSRRPATNSTGS